MKLVFGHTQLYKFLFYCNKSNLEKRVLDCGAGGACPPLALFLDHGYETCGIEMSDTQIERVNEFEKKHGIKLNISKGDMRELPFEDDSISFIYSYNSIFHMKKSDIAKSIEEIKRVLRPEGLCFINFLSTDDFRYGEGEEVGEGEFSQAEGAGTVIHTYYKVQEPDAYFEDMVTVYKEHRVLERIYEGEKIRQGFIDYIVKKSK